MEAQRARRWAGIETGSAERAVQLVHTARLRLPGYADGSAPAGPGDIARLASGLSVRLHRRDIGPACMRISAGGTGPVHLFVSSRLQPQSTAYIVLEALGREIILCAARGIETWSPWPDGLTATALFALAGLLTAQDVRAGPASTLLTACRRIPELEPVRPPASAAEAARVLFHVCREAHTREVA